MATCAFVELVILVLCDNMATGYGPHKTLAALYSFITFWYVEGLRLEAKADTESPSVKRWVKLY